MILMNDIWDALTSLIQKQNEAPMIDLERKCNTCQSDFNINGRDTLTLDDNQIVFFSCGHVHHDSCLPSSIREATSSPKSHRHQLQLKSIQALYTRGRPTDVILPRPKPRSNSKQPVSILYSCPICFPPNI